VTFFVAKINTDDLAFLGELLDTGKVKSVIDRRYELSDAAEALAYLGGKDTPTARSSSRLEHKD
jgi:NADPH:quinone reductase-like Zn-dependent oxidoreductase